MTTRTNDARSPDYPLSLRLSASALWGESFWGRDDPRRQPKGGDAPARRTAHG